MKKKIGQLTRRSWDFLFPAFLMVVLAMVFPGWVGETCAAGPGSSNVYVGLGDDGGLDNSRRAWDNRELKASKIRNDGVELKWKFDVATLFPDVPPGSPVFSRIVGPLATPQVDEDTVYFNTGAGWTRFEGIPPESLNASKIVALDRETGAVRWVADYDTIADQSLLMLADKFPHEYNRTEIEAYIAAGGHKASGFPGTFTPVSVIGDYVVTGDSTQSSELLAYGYMANSVAQGAIPPEYQGGIDYEGRPYISPSLGKEWGMRNDNPYGDANARRHLLRNAIMLLDKHTGELLAVHRYADAGEPQAQGYVNVGAALRMATPYVDPADGKTYIIAGCSGTTVFFPYTPIDLDKGRIRIAIANGNVRTAKGGRLTKFRVDRNAAGGVDLTEVWRFYTVPPMLEKGDPNPYTGEAFQTTYEADQYNYGFDGVWGQRPMIDFDRRQTCFANGNGKQMPVEDIKLARSPASARSANSHPEWSWQTWVRAFNAASDRDTGSAQAQREIFEAYRVTQEDERLALDTVTATRPQAAVDRYKQYLGNSISCVGLDDGRFRWTWRRTAVDTWDPQNGLILGSACYLDEACLNDMYPEFTRWQSYGMGGDVDFGQGPIHVRNGQNDIYVALGKDGSMQGLDPDTGAVRWYTQVGHPDVLGGMNYGATTDGQSVYANLINFKRIDGFATVLSEGVLDAGGTPRIRLAIDALFGSFNQDGWYTDNFHDTFNDLGRGASKHYVNKNILIPSGTSYIAKVDAMTGTIVGNGPTNPFVHGNTYDEIVPVGDIVNHAMTSVADVLLVPGGSANGKLYAFSTVNFAKLWVYDTGADTAAIMPPGVDPISGQAYHTGATSPPVPAGRDIFIGTGETGFIGNYPGKYFYRFSLRDRQAKDK